MAKNKAKCGYCGREFLAENKELNRGNAKFCSRSCAAVYGNVNRPRARKSPNSKCANCGRLFYRKPSAIRSDDVYCSARCFYEATHPLYSREQLLAILKDFFYKNQRVPYHAEFRSDPLYPDPSSYVAVFGSWNKALEEAGLNPNKSLLGCRCVAQDGHKCHSLAEKIIDDWLSGHLIEHDKEVFYPSSLKRADWRVGNICIEYLGVSISYNHRINHEYQNAILEKRQLCQKHSLALIELYPDDLTCLEDKLRQLLT